MKRIVVTGMGTVNPLGHTVEETWAKIKAGVSGIGPITRYDPALTDTKIAGEIKDFNPAARLGHKEARRMDRFAQIVVVSALDAMAQSGYEVTLDNTFDTGILISAGFGGTETLTESFETLFKLGAGRIRPTAFPAVLSNMAAAMPAMFLGIKGVTFSLSAACATSAVSIGEGAEVIRRGDANVVLVGGSEAGIMPIAVGGLNAMRAISTRNDSPQGASRPFDITRDGFVPSEGAAVLVLESLEHAQARGAKILAEVIGYAATCDATHVTAPDSDGAAVGQAMRRALAKAGLTANDIDYINAHGTSTKLNDSMETKAIKQVFGEQAYNIPISSTKSMTGHAMSASGALEAIFCVMAMNEGIMPPTINLEHPDPECDLDYIPHTARKKELRYVMSNSFGFGGQNAVLVMKKWENGKA
jgi:3-oxoacyl-[acyl-carrier-protein] synthase II